MKVQLKPLFFLFAILGLWFPAAVTQSKQTDESFSLGVSAISTYNGILADPSDPLDESARIAIDLYQESLVDWRWTELADPELIGELAEDYRSLADEGKPNVCVFNLRPGAKWHDDVAFTAEDVIFTFDMIRNPELQSPYKTQLDQALASSGPSDSFCAKQTVDGSLRQGEANWLCPYYALDPATLVVYGSGIPDQDFYESLVIPIIPKHIWETVDVSPESWENDPGSTGLDPTRVLGTGQYRFKSRTTYNDCGPMPDSYQLPAMPDEDVLFRLNDAYNSPDGAWLEYSDFVLRIYACESESLSVDDRIVQGILDGVVNANMIYVEYRELPPWGGSENPWLTTSVDAPISETEDSWNVPDMDDEVADFGPGSPDQE